MVEEPHAYRIEYLPTPEEIYRQSAAIRARWTAAERRRRRVGPLLPCDGTNAVWYPPVVDTSLLRLAAQRPMLMH